MQLCNYIFNSSNELTKFFNVFIKLTVLCSIHFLKSAPDYSPPLGDLKVYDNEWVEIETKVPKGWCEPQSSNSSTSVISNISLPISIPSCDNIDESDVPAFIRSDL